jgi:DTW domain-containing protein YfiP
MTRLCVEGSRLIQGESFDECEQVAALLDDPSNDCRLLFPGKRALDIGAHGCPVPADKRLVIFVLDGTWITARRMYRMSRRLQSLPQICFQPSVPSEYRFKKQPDPHCLSTLEAVHRLIGVLEPEIHADNLMEVFRGMVETQLRFGERNSASPEA